MFDKIVTITCNPALDATIWLDTFDYDEPNITLDEQTYAAGKGVNVSKVLKSLSYNSVATGFIGYDNQAIYTSLLEKDNINFDFVTTSGVTRENLTLILPNKAQLKINRRGVTVHTDDWIALHTKIRQHIKHTNNSLLVFAGSIPSNLTHDEYTHFISSLKADNVKIAVDSNLLTIQDYKEICPFIIKPNFNEMKKLMNVNFRSESALIRCINELSGFIEHILVSVGPKGLLYGGRQSDGKDLIIKALVPKVTPLSTVGAGDSTLAGFIVGLQYGATIEQCVKLACSCGTASVLLDGTQIISKANTLEMYDNIVVAKVKGN